MSDAGSGLIDIVEPAAPVLAASGVWMWLAGVVAVILLLLLLFVLWKFKLPAYRALRNVREVRRKLKTNELTPHESVLLLALELRHGLGVKRLLADKMPEHFKPQESGQWQEFMHKLEMLMYQHDPDLNPQQLAELFARAETWLRRYSRRSPYRTIGK